PTTTPFPYTTLFRSVVLHNFADHSRRFEPGQTGEIHRAFGLTGAHEDAAIARAQRENMSRRYQILRFGVVCDGIENRFGSVGSGDRKSTRLNSSHLG